MGSCKRRPHAARPCAVQAGCHRRTPVLEGAGGQSNAAARSVAQGLGRNGRPQRGGPLPMCGCPRAETRSGGCGKLSRGRWWSRAELRTDDGRGQKPRPALACGELRTGDVREQTPRLALALAESRSGGGGCLHDVGARVGPWAEPPRHVGKRGMRPSRVPLADPLSLNSVNTFRAGTAKILPNRATCTTLPRTQGRRTSVGLARAHDSSWGVVRAAQRVSERAAGRPAPLRRPSRRAAAAT